jgi:7,8-dihydro-6-hydroxymethylpterin-pyrophosphokinase
MADSLIDDSKESRGVTANGTPLGVHARLSLSFDPTVSEDVTASTAVWQQILDVVKGQKVIADVTVHLIGACDGDLFSSERHENSNDGAPQNIEQLTFTEVPVSLVDDAEDGVDAVTGVDMYDDAPTKASLAGATIAEQMRKNESDKRKSQQQDTMEDVYAVARRAIIAMSSKTADAEKRFRSAIVSIDAVPGNQVEGISPLYRVMGIDSSDASAAVIQVTTKLKPQVIVSLLDSLSASHEGAVALRLVDIEGESVDSAADIAQASQSGAQDVSKAAANTIELPLIDAKTQAEILAPWLDMDPDARLDGDPVSYLLAMAPDTARVGKVDDRWILGETQ